tara:strand:- start:752 stop:1720 length:969 start_codon:yes stop_codon:yes gene_type:complete
MIVKIFNTIGPRACFTSIFLIISSVFFSFLLEKNVAQLLEKWADIISKIFLMISFITMITLLEIQIKGRKIEGIHLISFPTVYLFFPNVYELKTIPILQAILLTFGLYVFIKTRHSKNTGKWILDLSLIISIIVQFNYFFSIFYLLPLFVFFRRGLKEIKNIFALLLPILIIPYTLNSLSVILPSKTFNLINPPVQIKLLNIQLMSNADMVWLITLLLASLSCIVQLSRRNRKLLYPEFFSGFIYMTFWLFFSIAVGLLGLQTASGRWFISFIPVAYFFGGFIEKIESNSLKNNLFTILFLGIVIFKLFDHGIISLELPFRN